MVRGLRSHNLGGTILRNLPFRRYQLAQDQQARRVYVVPKATNPAVMSRRMPEKMPRPDPAGTIDASRSRGELPYAVRRWRGVLSAWSMLRSAPPRSRAARKVGRQGHLREGDGVDEDIDSFGRHNHGFLARYAEFGPQGE